MSKLPIVVTGINVQGRVDDHTNTNVDTTETHIGQ